MTSPVHHPRDPDRRFVEFVEKSAAIEGEKLLAAIPREYMKPSVATRSSPAWPSARSLYCRSHRRHGVLDQWYLVVPLVRLPDSAAGDCTASAHDCGHGSFSRNRRLNFLVGHVALLPLLYPFHAWRHVHNWHHAHTNSLELDNDWRPISEEVYRRMPLRHRILYVSMRTWAVWAGSINYWVQSVYDHRISRRRRRAAKCGGRLVWVATAGGAYLAALTYLVGWQGLLLCFVAPWFAIHAWFSITTLMHHSSEDIPFLPAQYWSRNASKLLVTTDFVYPRWLLFLTHNISLHTAHHVSTAVPFYHLRKAQAALKRRIRTWCGSRRPARANCGPSCASAGSTTPSTGLYSTRIGCRRADPAKAGRSVSRRYASGEDAGACPPHHAGYRRAGTHLTVHQHPQIRHLPG